MFQVCFFLNKKLNSYIFHLKGAKFGIKTMAIFTDLPLDTPNK
jgi:hypothetical protein